MAAKKQSIIFSPLAAAIVAGVVFIFFIFLHFRGESYSMVKFQLKGETFTARIADTDSKRARGLSGSQGIAKNEAMVFLMPSSAQYSFWMKDMQYPLDILWARAGKIVDIAPRVPPALAGTPDSELTKYTSRVPADVIIEVNAGTVDRLDIKIGDEIKNTQ